jgi:hypothetical protein
MIYGKEIYIKPELGEDTKDLPYCIKHPLLRNRRINLKFKPTPFKYKGVSVNINYLFYECFKTRARFTTDEVDNVNMKRVVKAYEEEVDKPNRIIFNTLYETGAVWSGDKQPKNHLSLPGGYSALCGRKDAEWMFGQVLLRDGKWDSPEIEKAICKKCLTCAISIYQNNQS